VKCHALFGIEADFAFADFDSNSTILGALLGPGAPTLSRSMDWLGSIRTKSGIALGDVTLYVTGGIAFANIETSLDFSGLNITRVDDMRIGWVAGVGTEYALTDTIRITGDVLYYDFGTESSGLNPALGIPIAANFDDHHSLWVSRIGLNFKLGDRAVAYEPLK
jgi:outer membrane immunogenic protein